MTYTPFLLVLCKRLKSLSWETVDTFVEEQPLSKRSRRSAIETRGIAQNKEDKRDAIISWKWGKPRPCRCPAATKMNTFKAKQRVESRSQEWRPAKRTNTDRSSQFAAISHRLLSAVSLPVPAARHTLNIHLRSFHSSPLIISSLEFSRFSRCLPLNLLLVSLEQKEHNNSIDSTSVTTVWPSDRDHFGSQFLLLSPGRWLLFFFKTHLSSLSFDVFSSLIAILATIITCN